MIGGRFLRFLPVCQAGTADYSFDHENVNKLRTVVAGATIRSRGFKGAISASRPLTDSWFALGRLADFFVIGRRNLSPKTTANWVLASNHSRGGRFHSSAAV